MTLPKSLFILLVPLALMLIQNKVMACSMYKITVDGHTMVGCNHDTWLTTPKIWFENAKHNQEFGMVCTGSRAVAHNRTTPQSGMNTEGLVFSRLTSYYPTKNNPFTNRLKITSEADYLSDILHQCTTVQEVKKHIERYDHSFFLNDVFIYIDRFGDYLILEPYNLIEGHDPHYVLANFCPSITNNHQARKLERYRNGEDFLKSHPTLTSLDFCTKLSDTMSVCRSRNGDGTLITSIFDLQEGLVHLSFYHNFDHVLHYRLSDELAKGDHTLSLPEIFPKNAEFERLVNYKTPANTVALRILLLLLAAIFALLAVAFVISFVWKGHSPIDSTKFLLVLPVLNLILVVYILILLTHQSIFYFDVPYQDYSSTFISISSYTPFLLLFAFIPILVYSRNRLKSDQTRLWVKSTLVLNNIAYFILVLGFGYWGLYTFWK